MTVKKYAILFIFALAFAPISFAHAVEQDADFEFSEQPVFEKEDKGFSYELSGNAEEEGALKLFVKNAASEHEIYDINADDLNRITPAAGIKLQFDF